METNLDEYNINQILTINVGSRKSQLALIQTNQVIQRLKDFYSNNPDLLRNLVNLHKKTYNSLEFNIVSLKTKGDKVLDKPLPKIGTKSLFTEELETELLNRKVCFIVHSLKDLPTSLPDGCIIGAILKRDSPYDAIVLKKSLKSKIDPINLLNGNKFNNQSCEKNHVIGTSSLRRIAMIKRYNSNIECVDIRGNLNTRLSKLDNEDGEFTAIVLAQAGLDRMNWSDRGLTILTNLKQDINFDDWCYAVGQGAIAVECRAEDKFILDLLNPIVDFKTTYEVVAERSLMKKLEGGCSVPLGVRSVWLDDYCLKLDSIVLSIDGQQTIKASGKTELEHHEKKAQKYHDLDVTDSTITAIKISNPHSVYQKNIITCSQLGIKVASDMIKNGCLSLMRESR